MIAESDILPILTFLRASSENREGLRIECDGMLSSRLLDMFPSLTCPFEMNWMIATMTATGLWSSMPTVP